MTPGRDVNGNRSPVSTVSPGVRSSCLLRVPTIWIISIVATSVLIFSITLFYIGSVVDPEGHLSGLPVALANEDQGVTVLGRHVDIGNQVVLGLQDSSGVSSRLSLHVVTIAQAEKQMNSDDVYATVVIPTLHFISAGRVSSLAVFTISRWDPNRASLDESSIGFDRRAAGEWSGGGGSSCGFVQLGRQLSEEASKLSRAPRNGITTSSSLDVITSEFNPLPPNSALGLSAFYVSLLALMCGFLGAIFINTTVDGALGYGSREIGPKWTQRPPAAITRWQTLLTKWIIAVVIVPMLNGIVLLVAVGILHMNAPFVGELWLFTSFGALAVAVGTLALLADWEPSDRCSR